MKRFLTLLILVLSAIFAPTVHSQTVTITSTSFGDSAGNPYSGIVLLAPTLSSGLPTSYQKPGGGTVTSTAIQAIASHGAFTFSVPDTNFTSPAHICFKLTAPGITTGYNCLQPHYTATGSGDWCQAGVCNLNNYGPNVPPQATVPVGPQGPAGPSGGSPSGTGIVQVVSGTWGTPLASVPIALGGTGAITAGGALTNLGAAASNAVVSSINGTPGAFTLSGSGVSCTGTTCTISSGSGTVNSGTTGQACVYGGSGTTCGGATLGIGGGGTSAITAAGAFGNIVAPGGTITGAITHVPTSFTPFEYPFFSTSVSSSSADIVAATLSTPLGITSSGRYQGWALHQSNGNFLHGGRYQSQQANVLSEYLAAHLSRTSGSSQLYQYYGAGLGEGDLIGVNGNNYCAGGMGNLSGGTSVSACQAGQFVTATWPYAMTATLNSGSDSSNNFTYNGPSAVHENFSAGSRTMWDISKIVNTGTVTVSGQTATFSGAPSMSSLNPIGWLLISGSNAVGYAPNYNGSAGGASGEFLSFANSGAIYAVSAPSGTGATGYGVGEILNIVQSGCTGAVATVQTIDGSGQPTSYVLDTLPTGSGCAVANNLSTTVSTYGGSGTGALINITQITGVIGAAGSSCRIKNFTGGTGATGPGSGGLTLELTGTNTIAANTPFTGIQPSAIWPGYNNLVNATGASMQNGSTTCAGNINLTPTSGPCQGDDVIIDGACWGHPQRVTAVNSSTSVTIENGYDIRLISANTASQPFVLIPATSVNDITLSTPTATGGHGYGAMFTITSLGGGGSVGGTSVASGGQQYQAGDVLSLKQGTSASGGSVNVLTVDANGAILTDSVASGGIGYTTSGSFQSLGTFLNAVANGGSGIAPATYQIYGTGGLAPGLTCATPPTSPSTGNLACAEIQIAVGSSGTVTSVATIKSGGPVYTTAPTFTMTNSTLAVDGVTTAGCASTCPTFTGWLDTHAVSSFASGDTIAQPPDHRVVMMDTQNIENSSYIDFPGGVHVHNVSNGPGLSAFSIDSNYAYDGGLGGHLYGLDMSSKDVKNYFLRLSSGNIKYSMAENMNTVFGRSVWDWATVTAPLGDDWSGANLNAMTTGTGQPSAVAPLFLKPTQSLCFGVHSSGVCNVQVSGQVPTANTWLASSLASFVPTFSGMPGYYSAVFTDNTTTDGALAFLPITDGVEERIYAPNGSSAYSAVAHVYQQAAGSITDMARLLTLFNAGLHFSGADTTLTSSDGTGSRVVTIAPGGTISSSELPAGGTSYYSTWSPMSLGGIMSTGSASQMTLSANITIVRLEITASNLLTGCSTQPIVSIFDQTSSNILTSVTLSNGSSGAWDSGVISVSATAGHVLRYRISTAGVGCSTPPSYTQATMQYHG